MTDRAVVESQGHSTTYAAATGVAVMLGRVIIASIYLGLTSHCPVIFFSLCILIPALAEMYKCFAIRDEEIKTQGNMTRS